MDSRICVAIGAKTFKQVEDILKDYDFAEIRLDLNDMDEEEIRLLFGNKSKKLIATCRSGKYNRNERISRLNAAIQAGAVYVDIEVEEDVEYQQYLINIAKQASCKIIISHHDFEKTPDNETLDSLVAACKNLGADVVKLVTTANDKSDCARILGLYGKHSNLLAFAMGDIGRITRFACLFLGAPFTYVSVDAHTKVASGQFTAENLTKLQNLFV